MVEVTNVDFSVAASRQRNQILEFFYCHALHSVVILYFLYSRMNSIIRICVAAALFSTVSSFSQLAVDICPAVYDPVCSSHGKTFNNECEFLRETAQLQDIFIIALGRCEDRPVPTGNCSCPGLNPVCGSDGVIYKNICKLTCNQKFVDGLLQVDMDQCKKLETR